MPKQPKRIITIGLREKWDWEALDKIATWADGIHNMEDLARMIWDVKLDQYDMTTKPRKGDAYEALREHKDTIAVIALHLYGLDEKKHSGCADLKDDRCDGGYRYTKHNHKFLDLCLKRNIPFFVVGDQPIYDDARIPDGILRDSIGETEHGRDIYIYRRDQSV
jgi:hypothetical protein